MMSMTPFIRYNVYISPEQLHGLQQIYDEEGVKIAEQIRRALDVWLLKKGHLAKKTRVPFKVVVPSNRERSKR